MIILTHHTGEPHGILGAQAAATYFSRHFHMHCMVVGVRRDFDQEALFRFIEGHYQEENRRIAFSHLCGRKDLVLLAEELKQRGFRVILGGPQAWADYGGEPHQDLFSHRFRGLKHCVDLAVQGPVDLLTVEHLEGSGCIQLPWSREISLDVDWSNLFVFSDVLRHMRVRLPQVVQAVGCQYANNSSTLVLPPPVGFDLKADEVPFVSRGCVFCDVARDKGFHGLVEEKVLFHQVHNLPEDRGIKVPFELIDEYPLRSLVRLFQGADRENIRLSQVNLVCRVDDITRHAGELQEALKAARARKVRIMFSSIGFESFSDRILGYFNKGITVDDSIACVRILRDLKSEYRETLLYRRDEGAFHGFIHPTPWDDDESMAEMNRTMHLHGLFEDILPEHSIPLIIHHASCLGNWIRSLEERTGARFGRDGNWIEWWHRLEDHEKETVPR